MYGEIYRLATQSLQGKNMKKPKKKDEFAGMVWVYVVCACAPMFVVASIMFLLIYFSGRTGMVKVQNVLGIFAAGLLLSAYQAKYILECDPYKWVASLIVPSICQAAVYYSFLVPIRVFTEKSLTLFDSVVVLFALAALYKARGPRRRKKANRPTLAEWWKRETSRNYWHVLKVIVLPLALALAWLLYLPLAAFYNFINPAHSGGGPFSYTGGFAVVGIQVFIGLSLFVPALFAACIGVNLIYWCIPQAELAFAREAKNDPNLSFHAKTEELLFYLKRYLPLGYLAAFLGTVAFRFI